MRLESVGIGLAHAISLPREVLPRPAAVGYTEPTGRTLRHRRLRVIPALDGRIDINRFA
jgi:hypothetical protein